MPEKVGAEKIEMILGKHSGQAAFKARLAELGLDPSREELDQLSSRIVKAPKARKGILELKDQLDSRA